MKCMTLKICELRSLMHELKSKVTTSPYSKLHTAKHKTEKIGRRGNVVSTTFTKTDGLSPRHWWIFLQDKNGNLKSKNRLVCCRPVWFGYASRIPMQFLADMLPPFHNAGRGEMVIENILFARKRNIQKSRFMMCIYFQICRLQKCSFL